MKQELAKQQHPAHHAEEILVIKRELLFKDAEHYFYNQDQLDKYMLGNNSWWNWLRSLIKPNAQD